MNPRHANAIATACVACVLALAPAAAAAADDIPWIHIEKGPKFSLTADRDRQTLPIPIGGAGGTLPDVIRLRLKFAAFQTRLDSDVQTAFSVPTEIKPNANGYGPQIPLGVDLTTAAEPGIYTLVIEARADRRQPVALTVEIERPAATLRDIPPLTIRQWRGMLGRIESVESMPLLLAETQGHAQVTGVKAYVTPFAASSGEVSDATVVARGMPTTVPAGRPASGSAQLIPTAPFPLGTSRGTLELRAPQLTAPVTVAVVVESRVVPIAIIYIVMIGLATGYVIRVTLALAVQRSEARLAAFEMLDLLRHEKTKNPDAVFGQTIDTAVADLRTMIDKWDAKAITDGTATAKKDLESALKDLDQHRTVVKDKIDTFEMLVVNSQWFVPDGIRSALEAIAPRLEKAVHLLAANDVSRADAEVDSCVHFLNSAVNEILEKWPTEVRRALDATVAAPLPAYLASLVTDAVAELKEVIAKAPAPAVAPSLKDVDAALRFVHSARVNLKRFVLTFANWIAQVLDETMATIGGVLAGEPVAVRLKRVVSAYTQALRVGVDHNVEHGLDLLTVEAIARLDRAFRAAIIEVDKSATPDVQTALEAHDYRKAASLATATGRGTLYGAPGTTVAVAPDDGTQLSAFEAQAAAPAVAGFIGRIFGVAGAAAPVAVSKPSSVSHLLIARGLRTLFAFIGISALGYLLFHETWIGTPSDAAKIFLWAFSLDITVDAVLEQAGKLKKD
jgi:hypothetical protein